jgi:2'-5' RNA ligase
MASVKSLQGKNKSTLSCLVMVQHFFILKVSIELLNLPGSHWEIITMPTYSDDNSFLIWILPTDNSRNELTAIIRQLAKKYNTVPFIPHCTIARVVTDSLDDGITMLLGLKERLKPVDLNCRKIDYRKKIQKSLFLDIELTNELQELYQQIKNNFQFAKHDKFNPHISLMYSKSMSIKEKESLKNTITFKSNYSFDKIGLVSTPAIFGKWKIEYRQTM